MTTKTLLCVLVYTPILLTIGCEVKEGGFDGSLFDDAGNGHDAAVGSDAGVDAGSIDAGETDAGSDSGTPSGLEDWPFLRAQASCDALLDCLGDEDLLIDTLGGRDCVTLNENLLRNGELRYLADSVSAGRVLHRPDEEFDCLEDIRAQGCEARSSRLPASCELFLIGTVEDGGECTIHEDCAGDAFCDKGAQATCPGTCAALQAQGMPCNQNDDAQCADGLLCFRGSCEPLGELSDACGTDLPRCKPGLVCLDEGSGEHCVDIDVLYFRALGETCDVDTALCEPGAVCASVSGTAGMCEEVVSEGAACKRAQPNQCPASQYCDAEAPGETGTCRDRPIDGETCLDRTQACADEHVCVAETCVALAQAGEGCIDDAQCYSGACGAGALCAEPLMCALP